MSALTDEIAGRREIADETFAGDLAEGERCEGVTFVGCTLTGSFARATLAACRFEQCTFVGADLSGARLPDTVLDGCAFAGVRALGTAWGSLARPTIPPDSSTWTDCRLDLGAFGGADLTAARLERCTLVDADLDGTILRGAVLDECDLRGARIIRADLRATDLRSSHGYVIDPRDNEVTGLKVDLVGASGLLAPFGIDLD
ncbi:pentapeptide repeat-containing protein [Janibacter sp. YIM B02568]|uniref:pentapeptide repeat-containing protein n=1 Tax=Janibacter endophyticus TaxID=2806261 RepID=UPI00194F27AC|nr:pentapeptide repeat-containing protein [Janibacter endophyticus]MBM6546833.1 pentapeptide repeat-containing protein [Janibacter endophyticus]